MKRLIFFSLMCLAALTVNAQRIAVLGFKAGANVSLSDIDGISETFQNNFNPQGYTPVDRLFIDKTLSEQRLQQSEITESLAVRLGVIMNVSKVVVGKVYISFDGGYQVEATVLDVQSEQRVAGEGVQVQPGRFRETIAGLARRLASKIAIAPGSVVGPATPAPARTRSTVEVVYGYLKVFPKELGVFQAEPTGVIAQINRQAQHGYNNWRIPTNEELSLLRANGYLGGGDYMTRENKRGIVLLVSDGDDYQTLQAAEERRAAELKAEGFVDLGLPSGTLWKDKNEGSGFYSYDEAVSRFGDRLPTEDQFKELRGKCRWSWTGDGYKVTGPNGNSIVLPAAGYIFFGSVDFVGSTGLYWSSTPSGSEKAVYLHFNSGGVDLDSYDRCLGRSVRLVQD